LPFSDLNESRQSCPFVAMENKELRSFYGEKDT
jgi:hypothetical protein